MTQETVLRLIEKNFTTIYGYAFNKLYDKSEAEDLSQEIIIKILSSAENLKNDAAFWGFTWKIAENKLEYFSFGQSMFFNARFEIRKIAYFITFSKRSISSGPSF